MGGRNPPERKSELGWEAWHFGYTLNAGSASLGYGRSREGGDGAAASALPAFVPGRFARMLAGAAQHWSVSAALLAAQLLGSPASTRPPSRLPARRASRSSCRGRRVLWAATTRSTPRRDRRPGHLMRDLLRQLRVVSLALAAYNAGAGGVRRACASRRSRSSSPAWASILGLLAQRRRCHRHAGLTVRLVR